MTQATHVYGIHTVLALLQHQPQQVVSLYLKDPMSTRFETMRGLLCRLRIPWQKVSLSVLNRLSKQGVHQGVVAKIHPLHASEKALHSHLDALSVPPLLLILDGIQDPQNLGASLRSANAAGVHGVLIPKDKSVGLTPLVYKVASGALGATPVFFVSNLARTLKALKKRNIWIYGASGNAKQSLYEAGCALGGPVAWVLGAEGRGLRRLTQSICDSLYVIPMQGSVASLNVSVAVGICLFETYRQRLYNR